MKHRALVIGAGRIGAGYGWHDDEYTHAGAYRALSDRVELCGFVEADPARRVAAEGKWKVRSGGSLETMLSSVKPDIVSVCVQPEQQEDVLVSLSRLDPSCKIAIWCEKPWMPKWAPSLNRAVQVNYMRRGDKEHRFIASVKEMASRLIVYGKDDIHTRCHFEDLAKWWNVPLDYRPFNGPCAYVVTGAGHRFFDNGGVDGGTCFKAMLGNLIDHIEGKAELWAAPRQ